jgi:hypothetical protein
VSVEYGKQILVFNVNTEKNIFDFFSVHTVFPFLLLPVYFVYSQFCRVDKRVDFHRFVCPPGCFLGITSIGGNFYQDAVTNVFCMSSEIFASQGRIVFFRDNGEANTGARRYVTCKPENINAFNRGQSFIAFSEIEIRTKDTVVVAASMGIDDRRLVRNTGDYGDGLGRL